MVTKQRSSQTIRVLTPEAVDRFLPMATCIELIENVLGDVGPDDSRVPVRLVLHAAAGDVALMPAQVAGTGALGYKAVTVFPGARERGETVHQGIVGLLDPWTGRVVALVDGTAITRMRTAAVSAVATRYLARRDASVLAVLGSGVQAGAHLEALPLVRDMREVRVWARRPAEAERVAAAYRTAAPSVRAIADARTAVTDADIIVTATSAVTPILERSWLKPGCHINAVGACVSTAREIDAQTMAAARLFVDDRRAALIEAGDILMAIGEGTIAADHIAGELSAVIRGELPGRTNDTQITVFESLGLGVEDVAAADYVLKRAVEQESGTLIRLA